MKRGLFITFEGPDGCGKSTQAKLLANFLRERRHDVVLTREPGGTPLAEEIRRVILTPTAETLDPTAEILLYTAARAQHVNQFIRPALTAGKIVISDRFSDSTLAYQGFGLGRDLNLIREIYRLAFGDFQPDLTILLDLEIALCQERRERRVADRIESRDPQFHQRVREGYLEVARKNSRFMIIDASRKSIAAIHSEITAHLTNEFNTMGL